jgi:GNAT superfamily N-acetyltransferase
MAIPVLTKGQTILRPAVMSDASDCGRIFFDAFATIANQHNFPIEPSSPQFTAWKVADMFHNAGFYGTVAEQNGRVIGSIFMDERSSVVGIGPLTVDPEAQDGGIGRLLMQHALDRCAERGAPGVRLVQTAYHYRSLALYARLGFQVREPLSVLQGELPTSTTPLRPVRQASPADLDASCELCFKVHGHERRQEVVEAITAGTARVVERDGSVSGYATGIGYGWHAVARTNDDLIALITASDSIVGLGVLVPSRNSELLQWGLSHGLRIIQQSTLMTIGLYSEPAGAYLPSILF